jgi:hypothetical protein
MSALSVIMIPAAGKDAAQFHWSAEAVSQQVYGGRAIIVKVSVSLPTSYDDSLQFHSYPVRFTAHGRAFALEHHRHLRSFISISHAGQADGPIFYDDQGRMYQPWTQMATVVSDGSGHYHAWGRFDSHIAPEPRFGVRRYRWDLLMPRAQKFWHLVGRCLGPHGKIILLGCNYGAKTYLDKVALASGKEAYGPDGSISAGDVKTAVAFVKHIERGRPDANARRATPIGAMSRIAALSEIKDPNEAWDYAIDEREAMRQN